MMKNHILLFKYDTVLKFGVFYVQRCIYLIANTVKKCNKYYTLHCEIL